MWKASILKQAMLTFLHWLSSAGELSLTFSSAETEYTVTVEHDVDGFYEVFSDAFRESLIETNLPNKDSDDVPYFTQDYAFVPSAAEMGFSVVPVIGTTYSYFENISGINRKVKGLSKNLYVLYQGRTPGGTGAIYVTTSTGSTGESYALSAYRKVRPVLNIDPETPVSGFPDRDGAYELFSANSGEQPGSVRVVIEPEEARAAGAQWRLTAEGGLTQIFALNSYNGNKQGGYHLPWESPLIGLLHPGEDIQADMSPFDGYWVYLRGVEMVYSTPVGRVD